MTPRKAAWIWVGAWSLIGLTRPATVVWAGPGEVWWVWAPVWKMLLWAAGAGVVGWGVWRVWQWWLGGGGAQALVQAGWCALALVAVVAGELVGAWMGWVVLVGLGRGVWWVVAGAVVIAGWVVVAQARPREVAQGKWMKWVAMGLVGVAIAAFGLRLWQINRTYGDIAGGDEPQYLLVALSLALDHDLELADNSILRDSARYWSPAKILGGHGRWSPERGWYSKYRPGQPLLLAPACAWAMAVGVGVRWAAVGLMWLVGLWAAWEVMGLGQELAGKQWAGALAGVCFGALMPVVAYASTLFPELAAAGLTAGALRRVVARDRGGWPAALVAGLMTGAVGWWHERFLVVAGVLAVAGLWQWRRQPRALGAFLGPIAVSLAGLGAHFMHIYGVPWPVMAAHARGSFINPRGLWEGMSGLWVDGAEGLISVGPVLLAGFAGLVMAGRRAGWAWAVVGGVWMLIGIYVDWFGGINPPGRYLIVTTGVLAAGVGTAAARGGRWARAAVGVLALVSVGATAKYWVLLKEAYGHEVVLDGGWGIRLIKALLPVYILEPAAPNGLKAGLWLAVAAGIVVWIVLSSRAKRAWAVVGGWMAVVGIAASVGWTMAPPSTPGPVAKVLGAWQVQASAEQGGLSWLKPSNTPSSLELTPARYCHRPARALPGGAALLPGGRAALIWGQYLDLPPGHYEARVWISPRGKGWMDITTDCARHTLAVTSFNPGPERIILLGFTLGEPVKNLEIRLGGGPMVVSRMELARLGGGKQ